MGLEETEAPSGFIGRQRELSELEAALDEVLAGEKRLFLFAGEPGIGKTRLAEEVAGKAARRGAKVFWGRTWDSEGAPPYWPWIQILRSLAEEAKDAGVLRERIGGGLPYLLPLLPELREILPEGRTLAAGDPAIGSSEDPARQRFYLFDAVTRFVANATAGCPHVLVLDDLQWSDVPSLLLLRFMARELRETPVLLLGTYRDVEARSQKQLGELLSSLAREGRVIHLEGLSEPEVARLLNAWRPQPVTDELVSNVCRATDGNPFFVEGILRLLASSPSSGPPGALPIPDEVRDAVRPRLQRLPEEVREVLTVAAVLGREFSPSAIVSVTEVGVEAAIERLEAAHQAAIVAETKGGCWRFRHDLFRDVVLEDLGATARMKLHARAGAALESLYGESARSHATELAAHFHSALPLADAGKAIEYRMLAARQAMRTYAWEDAVDELDRVLGLLESDPSANERERLDVLLDLGEAIWHSQNPTRHQEVLSEAVALARRLSLPRELARAVSGLVGMAPPTGGVDDTRVRLLDEALSTLGEADLGLRGRLLGQLAWNTYFSPDRDWQRAAEECLQIARQAEEPGLLIEALRRRFQLLLGKPETLPERMVLVDELLDAVRRAGSREGVLVGGELRIANLYEAGDVAALDAELASYSRSASEIREPSHLWLSVAFRATRALSVGRWEEADRLSAEAFSLGQAIPENAASTFGAHQYELHYQRGRIESLLPSIREYVDRFPGVLSWRAALAIAWVDLGRARDARNELEVVTAAGLGALPADYMLPGLLAQLSVVTSFLGDVDRAGQLYPRVLPWAGRGICLGFNVVHWGAADRFLGLLAGTLSRWDDAERHFQAALEMNRRMGMGPSVARTQLDYAAMLLRRGEAEHRERAATLLRDAEAAARDFGMARLLEEVEEALRGLEDAPAQAGKGVPTAPAVLRNEGDLWTIRWQGNVFRLKSSRGLRLIHKLIGAAGRELHCIDLLGEEAVDRGDSGEILDAEAKATYRRRVEDLREALAEAESNNDVGRASRAREEIDFLGRELSAAVGLDGRDRRAGGSAERARVRATRAIRDAIARITRHDASLGQHLSTAIRTGAFCSYTPDPTSPVSWES